MCSVCICFCVCVHVYAAVAIRINVGEGGVKKDFLEKNKMKEIKNDNRVSECYTNTLPG